MDDLAARVLAAMRWFVGAGKSPLDRVQHLLGHVIIVYLVIFNIWVWSVIA